MTDAFKKLTAIEWEALDETTKKSVVNGLKGEWQSLIATALRNANDREPILKNLKLKQRAANLFVPIMGSLATAAGICSLLLAASSKPATSFAMSMIAVFLTSMTTAWGTFYWLVKPDIRSLKASRFIGMHRAIHDRRRKDWATRVDQMFPRYQAYENAQSLVDLTSEDLTKAANSPDNLDIDAGRVLTELLADIS